MDWNCSQLLKMAGIGWKRMEMARNGWTFLQKAGNGFKLLKIAGNGWKFWKWQWQLQWQWWWRITLNCLMTGLTVSCIIYKLHIKLINFSFTGILYPCLFTPKLNYKSGSWSKTQDTLMFRHTKNTPFPPILIYWSGRPGLVIIQFGGQRYISGLFLNV